MSDKPIHVQVAEALGWRRLKVSTWEGHQSIESWLGEHPPLRGWIPVPRYDTDWSATGPLIEKYNFSVGRYVPTFLDGQAWAYSGDDIGIEAYGPTRLLAVCALILQLSKAGKLSQRP